jgi:hypothetical protein
VSCRRCGWWSARSRPRARSTSCCIRFGSARYSVPNRLIGTTVTVLVDERDRVLRVIDPITGAPRRHGLVAPGETASSMPTMTGPARTPHGEQPARGPRPSGSSWPWDVAEQFLTGAAAAVTKLGTEKILTLGAAHGNEALLSALERAVDFGRWRAADVRRSWPPAATHPGPPRPVGPSIPGWC